MALTDYLDKGASLGPDEPCLIQGERTFSYAQVQQLSWDVAVALDRSGIEPGEKVAVLSANDPVAFACVFGISRAGAVWCPINPRNEAAETRDLLTLFECSCLIYQMAFAGLVERIVADLPGDMTFVCLDGVSSFAEPFEEWIGAADPEDTLPASPATPVDDTVMLVGTGGTTGTPKGVVLSDRNLETMSAITLMSYPFGGRPTYLALAPLTHAAGVLCFPIMALGGRIVIMAHPDPGEFLRLVEAEGVTHAFLPPTVIYLLLAHPTVHSTDFGTLQCFWYGAAPMSVARLEEAIDVFGPVMAQLFGQSEAPMMISTMAPAEHFLPDGRLARGRLPSAGRPSPLATVGIMDPDGHLLRAGEHGEIVVRSSLVMTGYYKDPAATAEASVHGWHHTGDIGYLDGDGYLFIVDRAKDMIISGGFNVYSAEVEQVLMQHPTVYEAAVVGLPDDKWGERVTAVIQPTSGTAVDPDELMAFVKARLGSVKTPKQVEVWPNLPRSRLGKVVKPDIKARLTESGLRQ